MFEGWLLSDTASLRGLVLLQRVCLNHMAMCLNRNGFLVSVQQQKAATVGATQVPLEGKQRRGLLRGDDN